MSNLYTTKTAALKATKADVSKLNTKSLKVNGKDVATSVKHPNDTREVITENDLWCSWAEIKDGEIIFHEDEVVNNPNKVWNINIAKVENNKAYTGEIDFYGALSNLAFCANVQTEKIKGGYNMFSSCANLTTFASDLSSLTIGCAMFIKCDNLTTITSDLSSLINGSDMFHNCSKLTTFTSDLSSLINGDKMFYNCSKLTTFTSDYSGSSVNLSNLTNGQSMFEDCSNLESFSSELPSLTDGGDMFQSCSNLESFSSELPRLTNGKRMFYHCTALTAFSSDLSSLTTGEGMFNYCINLTSFSSYLSSLTDGKAMFFDCKLDAQSVANIIHFIPQRDAKPTSSTDNGNISIGLGITNTDAAKQAFAEECYCNNWEELNKEFDDKNWTVHWQFNGPASYSLRDPRPSTAVYTKLEEVFLPSDEKIAAAKENGEHIQIPHYQYTSQDGSKFYNIYWYHESNTNNEGYDYFESLEMATLAYGVIPKA